MVKVKKLPTTKKSPAPKFVRSLKSELEMSIAVLEEKNTMQGNRMWCIHCGAFYPIPGHNPLCPLDEMKKLLETRG